jgi:outer membrane protease
MSNRRRRFVVGSVLLFAVLVAATLPGPVAAQSPSIMAPAEAQAQTRVGSVTFTLGASLGLVDGTAYERVYAPEVREFKVSELKWDITDVVMAGVQGAVDYAGWFRLNLDYRAAVTEGGGEMVDRDWLLAGSDRDEQWTHESRHPDTTVDSGTAFDVNLDIRAFSAGSFSLRGILGYRFDEWEWSSRGGTYVYTWDANGDGFITGDEYRAYRGSFPAGQFVISYRQEYRVPYLGLGCEGAWGPVQLQGRLLYSPWVSAEDHDYHALRDMTFDGDFSGGEWFGASLAGRWAFLPRWYAAAGVEYQQYSEVIGDIEAYGAEGTAFLADGGGMELETATLQLGAGFRF